MGVLSDDDLVAMRARARHRLFGALGLVLLLVVGVPLVFDRHQTLPPTEETDASHPGEEAKGGAPAQPSSVSLAGHPQGVRGAGAGAQPEHPAAGKTVAATPSTSPAAAAQTGAAAPPGEPGKAGEPGRTGEPGKAGDSGKAVAGDKSGEAARAAAGELARPQAVPDIVPPLESNGPGHRNHGAPADAAKTGRDAGEARSARPAREAEVRADDAGAAAHQADTAQTPHGWFVQFGMFAEPARAQNLSRQLESQGFKVREELIHGPRGSFTLVRAGPYATKAGADEVLARARGLGENAFLGHQ